MAELRELPCPVDGDFPVALDDTCSDRGIALGRIQVNGCEAKVLLLATAEEMISTSGYPTRAES